MGCKAFNANFTGFATKKVILFDPQRENFFDSLLKIFREVILDLSGLDFSADYNFTVSQKFSGDCGIVTCFIMNHFICKGVDSLKNL